MNVKAIAKEFINVNEKVKTPEFLTLENVKFFLYCNIFF